MTTTSIKPGDIRQWDTQSDIWQTSYKIIRQVEGNLWEIEQLPPAPAVIDKVIDFYAGHEAECGPGCTRYPHTPIRDRTWAECDEGQHPVVIGYTTIEDELMMELDRLEARTGQRMEIRFVSTEQWAKAF